VVLNNQGARVAHLGEHVGGVNSADWNRSDRINANIGIGIGIGIEAQLIATDFMFRNS
jgi:hypothetical protein